MSQKETCEENLVRKTAKITIHLEVWKTTTAINNVRQKKNKAYLLDKHLKRF